MTGSRHEHRLSVSIGIIMKHLAIVVVIGLGVLSTVNDAHAAGWVNGVYRAGCASIPGLAVVPSSSCAGAANATGSPHAPPMMGAVPDGWNRGRGRWLR
jgi:hypothetical protein